MKRGADAMDARDRDGQRTWNRPDHKRARHAGQGRPRNGNGNASTGATIATVRTLADEKETDPHRLAQRQKQIDYGKNTIGYDRYCAQVPRHQRRPGKHPMTPDKTKRMGKKVFDGIVRKWRQALHKYDPPELVEAIKTVEAENNVAEPTESSAKTDDADATAEKESATAASTESDAKKEAGAVPTNSEAPPPSRSIYENFDEDNFDEEDSDDDLL